MPRSRSIPQRRDGAVLVRVQSLQQALARMHNKVRDRRVRCYNPHKRIHRIIVIHVIYSYPALDGYRGLGCAICNRLNTVCVSGWSLRIPMQQKSA